MPKPPEVQVRPGREEDLRALTELYNHYVRETPVTFDLEPLSPEQRRPWLLSHPKDGPHRLLVALESAETLESAATPDTTAPAGRLLGYATSSPFRPRAAYATSVETSVYCAPGAVGLGVGTLLYTALFQALRHEDVHRAYAGIAQPNEASARLHARFGFRPVGVFREVGRKFGHYWDVAWYEKELTPGA
ncbi:N-acetyltransferase family protein [Streptomyces sp. NPDC046977]|uniref:GNAT family N-acetyltransferase n=1 Tax=Streptomyces sp. NPDC046977 TaxID=3154703 RepID=UPI00340CE047